MSKFNIGEDTSVTKTKSNSKNDMKYCRSCGFENMKNSKFCSECGNSSFYDTLEEYEDAKNSKYCVHCKSKVSVKMKFCTNCGIDIFLLSV